MKIRKALCLLLALCALAALVPFALAEGFEFEYVESELEQIDGEVASADAEEAVEEITFELDGGEAEWPAEPEADAVYAKGVEIPIDAAHFPDDVFRAYVAEKCDNNFDGILTESERSYRLSFELMRKGISDLTGIEYFPEITSLYCEENNLKTLDLSNNTKLQSLDCENNQIETLNVGNCKQLTRVNLGYNQIRNIDLSGNAALHQLYVWNNPLESLNLNGCASLPDMLIYNVTENYQGYNEMPLKMLDLGGCASLEQLTIQNTTLESLDLRDCAPLRYLNCSDNHLKHLNVSGCEKLVYLICNNNQIESLDLAGMTVLEDLTAENNQLSQIDISTCDGLRKAYWLGEFDAYQNTKDYEWGGKETYHYYFMRLDVPVRIIPGEPLSQEPSYGIISVRLRSESGDPLPEGSYEFTYIDKEDHTVHFRVSIGNGYGNSGMYHLSRLEPGVYTIKEDTSKLPSGLHLIGSDTVSVEAISRETNLIDFVLGSGPASADTGSTDSTGTADPDIPVITLTKNTTLTVDARQTYRVEVPGKTITTCKSGAAKVATVTDGGVVNTLAAGKAKITVNTDDKKKVTLTLKVVDPYAPTKVAVTQGKAMTVSVGEPIQLTADLTPATAQTTLTWTSGGKKVVEIDAATGLATPLKIGKATITVKTANGKKATIKLTVVDPNAPTGISLSSPKKLTLSVGETAQIVAAATPAAANQQLTWSSNKASIATVDENGLVTAVNAGSAKITAKTANGKKITVQITVKKGPGA